MAAGAVAGEEGCAALDGFGGALDGVLEGTPGIDVEAREQNDGGDDAEAAEGETGVAGAESEAGADVASIGEQERAGHEGPERADAVPVHLGERESERAGRAGIPREDGLVAGDDVGLDGGDQVVAGGAAELGFDGPGAGEAEVRAFRAEDAVALGDGGGCDGADGRIVVAEAETDGFDGVREGLAVGIGDADFPAVEADEVGGDGDAGEEVGAGDGSGDGVVALLGVGQGARGRRELSEGGGDDENDGGEGEFDAHHGAEPALGAVAAGGGAGTEDDGVERGGGEEQQEGGELGDEGSAPISFDESTCVGDLDQGVEQAGGEDDGDGGGGDQGESLDECDAPAAGGGVCGGGAAEDGDQSGEHADPKGGGGEVQGVEERAPGAAGGERRAVGDGGGGGEPEDGDGGERGGRAASPTAGRLLVCGDRSAGEPGEQEGSGDQGEPAGVEPESEAGVEEDVVEQSPAAACAAGAAKLEGGGDRFVAGGEEAERDGECEQRSDSGFDQRRSRRAYVTRDQPEGERADEQD